jgi:hypothetical protein
MEYRPDCWVVFRVDNPELEKPIYKVFGGWYGGFANGDSWKINSGITKAEEDENCYYFHGASGSVYVVHKQGYKMSSYMMSVWGNFMKQLEGSPTKFEILSEETKFMELDYS